MLKVKTFQDHFDSDYSEVAVSEFLTRLGSPCVEIRIFPKERQMVIDNRRINVGKCVNGYYTSFEQAARDIFHWDGKAEIYCSLQSLDPKLLRRGENKLTYNTIQTVGDKDVLSYEWILIDIDPDRPANTSSSDFELQASIDLLNKMIIKFFDPLGIEVLRGLSGNGAHGLIKIGSENPTKETSDKIKKILNELAKRYDTDLCKVDQIVWNPSRIVKLYGTIACKGEATEDAPWRRSKFSDKVIVEHDLNEIYDALVKLEVPKTISRETLKAPVNDNIEFDLEAYLNHHHLAFEKSEDGSGQKYKLEVCPFDVAHGKDAAVFKGNEGKLGFKCFHNGCSGNDWKAFRTHVGEDLKPFLSGLDQHIQQDIGSTRSEVEVEDDRPTIIVNNRQLTEVLADINAAVIKYNNPATLFSRGGHPTWLRRSEDGMFYSEPLSNSDAKIFLSQAAIFCRRSVKDDMEVITNLFPSLEICQAFLAQKQSLPSLKSIINFPCFRGSELQAAGYDESTGYFCASRQKPVLDMPLKECKKLLFEELLIDFPFTEESSKTNAIALMINALIRPMLPNDACTPLFCIDSSSPGTGKGLLAHVCTSFISEPSMQVLPEREEELKKSISSLLMSSPTFVIFDNVSRTIRSQSLASVLTNPLWSDRLLGSTKMLRLPNLATWIVTGNNCLLADEITRRSIYIRLDSNVERPWSRTGFKHANLRKYVIDNQPRILSALMSMIKLWIDAGRPKGKLSIGSFEAWAETISGILQVCGIRGFMENQDVLYDRLDDERQAWSAFIEEWHQEYGVHDVSVKTLFGLAATDEDGNGKGLLDEQLIKFRTEHSRKIGLGRLLREKEGRIFEGFKITSPGQRARAKIYALLPVNPHDPETNRKIDLKELLVNETDTEWLKEVDNAIDSGVAEHDLIPICQLRNSSSPERYFESTKKLDQLLAKLDQ